MRQEYKNLWVAILFAQSTIRRKVDAALSAADTMSLEEYDLLLTLEESPERCLDMSALGEQVLLTPSGVSRMVERLQRKEWVRVNRSLSNHRYKLVSITECGLRAREATWAVYREVIASELAMRLSPEDAQIAAERIARLSPGRTLIGYSEIASTPLD